jgi:adhesin/invasin
MKVSVTLRLYLIAAATIGVVVACQRVPLTSPTGSTITLTIDRNVLPINGETTVRAVVIESAGTPVHNGTVVTFATTLGSLNPPEAKTVNGIATTTFSAGSISGSALLRAFSGGATSSNASGTEVKIGSAAAGSVAVSATPPAVSQSGGTVTISALVLDANNNPLPGASVLFSASNGVLSSATAVSDSTGVAKVTLTTQSTTTVTATVGANRATVEVVASTAPSITIGDPSPSPPVAGQPMTFNVTVASGGAGNNTPRQVQTLDVQFGDGTRETRSNVTGSVGFTHTYAREGGYTITATATDTNNNTGIASKAIIVGFASQPTVTLSASPNPVPAADQGQTTFTVNAQAGSTSAPPVRNVRVTLQDGTVIYNSTSSGSQQFAYKFGGGGTYTATATVTDAAGNTGSTTTVVTVRNW